jgi:hypothetical protein
VDFMIEPSLAKYYEDRESMMITRGWSDLMDDVQKMFDATNDITSVQDEKTLHYRRGELSMMRWLLALKEVSEETYEELKNETTS